MGDARDTGVFQVTSGERALFCCRCSATNSDAPCFGEVKLRRSCPVSRTHVPQSAMLLNVTVLCRPPPVAFFVKFLIAPCDAHGYNRCLLPPIIYR